MPSSSKSVLMKSLQKSEIKDFILVKYLSLVIDVFPFACTSCTTTGSTSRLIFSRWVIKDTIYRLYFNVSLSETNFAPVARDKSVELTELFLLFSENNLFFCSHVFCWSFWSYSRFISAKIEWACGAKDARIWAAVKATVPSSKHQRQLGLIIISFRQVLGSAVASTRTAELLKMILSSLRANVPASVFNMYLCWLFLY